MTTDKPVDPSRAQHPGSAAAEPEPPGPLAYGAPGGIMSIPPGFFHDLFPADPAPIRPGDPDLISLADLAEALGFRPATLAHRADLGHFPAVKVGDSWMVRRRDFSFALRSAAQAWRLLGSRVPSLIQPMPVEPTGAVHAALLAAMARRTPTIRTNLDHSPPPPATPRRRKRRN